ncbi:MAG: SLC13 family permease, partial [Bacteroidetes bacterium]|nr:SLC13 family permease [Bacteroidota bacterium]
MTYEIVVALLITLIALVLFITEAVRVDVTAIIVMVLLMLSGVITPEEGISGFSNPATITVMALLILSAGLQSTGAVKLLGNQLLKFSGKKEWQIILMLMVSIGFISAFINNTAAVAVFLPVVIRIANARNISVSKLLIPMSVAAMLGGTCTLIGTSTNLLISSISASYGIGAFTMFEFSLLGVIFLAVGLVYMLFIGRHLIPARRKPENISLDYDIKEYLTELIVLPDSPFIGKNISESGIGDSFSIEVLEIIRKGIYRLTPGKAKLLQEGDVILVRGEVDRIVEVSNETGIAIKSNVNFHEEWHKDDDLILMEAIISADSFLNGKTIH